MKKLQALFFHALIGITVTSCLPNHHNVNITLSEDDRYFSMNAYFPYNETRDIEDYLDSRIGGKSRMSFTNTQTNAALTLDDHTTFYMKKSPGVLEIKLDKNENSVESYKEIKSMCQGIKKVLAK